MFRKFKEHKDEFKSNESLETFRHLRIVRRVGKGTYSSVCVPAGAQKLGPGGRGEGPLGRGQGDETAGALASPGTGSWPRTIDFCGL